MSPDTTNDAQDLSGAGDRIEAERYEWPTAELDPVSKMRVLAAGLPHVAIDETVFDVPFDAFWTFIEDLETNIPRFEGGVSRLRIISREGETMRLDARTPLGIWVRFDCVLRSGWMVMQSKAGQVGLAACPEGPNQTRFFHFERSTGRLGRFTRPFFAWNIRQDFRRLRDLFASNR